MADDFVIPALASDDSAFAARIVQILAPGERDLVAFLEAYFDESGSHDDSPVLCIAGYLYDKDNCIELDQKWNLILHKYSLPYFRMSAFAPGNPPFDKLTYQERVDAGREFIEAVKQHMKIGFSFSLCEEEYDFWKMSRATGHSAYTWACLMTLAGIRQWIEKTGFDGKIAYFFEAGHRFQKEANAVMNNIYLFPYMRKKFRYASHSFVDKTMVRPIQSADMLAWHCAKWIKDSGLGKRSMRKDFASLTERDTLMNHHWTKNYKAYHESFRNLSPEAIKDVITDILEL
jgi:Protein of unknown function (DUF3800)